MRQLCFYTILCCVAGPAVAAEPRVWTDSSGRFTTTATLITHDRDGIHAAESER